MERNVNRCDFLNEQARISRWITEQGVVIYYPTPAERALVREYLKDMPALFPGLLYRKGLRLLYLYEQEKQERDAVCWHDVTRNGQVLHAIGIARGALPYKEYFQLLFLHELAHVAIKGGHSRRFCYCLDLMIARFNEITGSRLVNDYDGHGKKLS